MTSKVIESENEFAQNHLNVCRLCLCEELLVDIFMCDGLNLWISDFLSIVVSKDDKISCSICALCQARLNEYHDYKQHCLGVQDVLHRKSFKPFEKNFPLGGDKKEKPSSEAHPELAIDARKMLQPTIPDIEGETDDDERRHYQQIVTTQSGQKRYYSHEKEANQNQKKYCSICGEKVHESRIEGHENRHKGVRPYKCEHGCEDVDFYCQQTQRIHHRTVHSEGRYECNTCNEVFQDYKNLGLHKVNFHSSKTYLCSICKLQITTRSGLHKHMKRMHDPNLKREFTCPRCNRSFKKHGYLQMHIKLMHLNGKSKKILQKKSVEKQCLLRAPKVNNESDTISVGGHLDMIEEEEKNIEPDLNPKQGRDTAKGNLLFIRLEDVLKSQKRTKSSKAFEKDLPLSEADIGKRSSEAHPELTIDTREELQLTIPDIGEITEDDKKRPDRLYQRIVIKKSGQKRYCYDGKKAYQNKKIECSTCGEEVHESRLEGHQNRHKGVQPYKCEHGCKNVEFYSRQTQRIHHRDDHSKEDSHNTFICSVCNLELTSRPGLYTHMKRMHDPNLKRKFSCPHCNRSFKKDGYLKMHLMQMHLMETLEKRKKGQTHKSVEMHDSGEAPEVKAEPDADSVEMPDEPQNNSNATVEGNPDISEAEDAIIEPDSNPEQGQDYSATLFESEEQNSSDQTVEIEEELLPTLQDLDEANQSKKIVCSICDEKVHESRLEGHQNRHKGVRPYKCEHGCENVDFYCRQTQRIHHRDVHNDEQYVCNICNMVFQSKNRLGIHKINVHPSKTYQCSVCNLQLTTCSGLHKHMKRMHDPSLIKTCSCQYCNRNRTHLDGMRDNSKNLLESPMVKIEAGADTLDIKDELQDDSHATIEGNLDLFEAEEAKIEPDLHPEQGQDDCTAAAEEGISSIEPKESDIDDPTIDIKKELQPIFQDVEDVLQDVQPQRIDIAEKGMKQKVTYSKAMYEKHKSWCSICDKHIYAYDMPGHQNMHKGIRPYKCKRGCENVDFFCRRRRQAHYRNIHNPQKQECPICHKLYPSKASLGSHKSTVHSEKKYECSLCDIKPFITISRLKVHMKVHNRGANYS